MFTRLVRFLANSQIRRRSLATLLTAALVLPASVAAAQTGGEGALQGTVTDATGAAIPGATVTATNQASNVKTTRTSTSAGLYSITPLIPGVYTVTVTAQGFSTLEQKNIEVNGLNVTGFNPKLSPGAVDQSVTVTEAPPQLQTSSPTVGDVITNEVYESLPVIMNGQQRDPSSLATLSVGAQGGTRAPIFSGTGDYLAEVYLNGIPTTTSNQQGDNRIIANSVPVESVDQLQIISSGPSAEYQGAGAIGFTIKSGGSKYHGQLVDVIRNTAFDAWGFAGNQLTKYAIVNGVAAQVPAGKPAEHQNELSASIGGPVPFMHHKLFFFVNYDRFHNTSTGNAAVFTVPTAQMKQGDFTQLNCLKLDAAQQAGCIAAGGATGNGAMGTHTDPKTGVVTTVNNDPIIFNPLTNSCTGSGSSATCTRQVFSDAKNGFATNNIIPASFISPISQFEQKLLPNPNLPGLTGNYLTSGYSGYDNWEIVGRVDYDLTSSQRLSVSYTRGLRKSIGYGSVMPLPYSTAISSILHPTMATIEHAWTLTPHLVNQFNYGFTRFGGVSLNASQGLKGTTAVDAGITGLPVGQATTEFPGSTFNSSPIASSVTDTNWGATGGSQRSSSTVPNTFTIVDNLQWSFGHHNITFGVQTQWLEDNATSILGTSDVFIQKWSPNDTANFSGSGLNANTSGYSYASFLIGAVNSTSAGVPLYSDIGGRYHPVSPYFQDNWQIRPNLTLNLGLRWDYLPPYHEVADRWSFFNPNATNPLTGSPGELEYAGTRGADISCQCRTPVHTYWKNWGPRLGLEFSPDPKTVFRAGFAVAYSRAGGVGGRAGDAAGTGQTGFGSSIILPAALTSTVAAGPSYYLNNSAGFKAAGAANTNFGGPGYTVPPPTGASASELTIGTGNYEDASGKYVTAGGAPAYADPYLSGRAPEFIFYNFGMQKALTNAMTITLNYSGSQSHFVAGASEPGFWSGSMDPKYLVSLGTIGVGAAGKETNILNLTATPANYAIAHAADSSVVSPYPGYVASNASGNATIGRMLRPFQQYSAPPGLTWDNIANLAYNAFDLILKMREYKGVNFTVNYTYSKNLGDDGTVRSYYAVPAAASSSGVALPGNNRMDRSLTHQDIPENLNVFGYGKLPFGRGHIGGDNWAVRNIAGGWQLSGIFRYSAGEPLLVVGSGCNSPGQGTCMPDLAPGRDLGSARINGGYGHGVTYADYTQQNYLDPNAFARLHVFPINGRNCSSLSDTSFDKLTGVANSCSTAVTKIGTAPRSSSYLRGPGSYNIDASLQRTFNLSSDRVKFVFRADCFNVLNNVNFSMSQTQTVSVVDPSNTTSFGRLTGYSSPRRFQFQGRLVF